MAACMSTYQKRVSETIIDRCEPPCLELNSGPLEGTNSQFSTLLSHLSSPIASHVCMVIAVVNISPTLPQAPYGQRLSFRMVTR